MISNAQRSGKSSSDVFFFKGFLWCEGTIYIFMHFSNREILMWTENLIIPAVSGPSGEAELGVFNVLKLFRLLRTTAQRWG